MAANVWVSSGGRQEKIEFAVPLDAALRDAHWKTNGVTTRLMSVPIPTKFVIVRWREGAKTSEAAKALMNALSEKCITAASGGSFTDNGDFWPTVFVGPKPPEFSEADTIFGPQPLPNADISIAVGEAF
jgi:hypothetical protein